MEIAAWDIGLTLGFASCAPQSCFCSLWFIPPSLQGTHESLKGNAKALSTVTAIIDGTGSVGVYGQGVLAPGCPGPLSGGTGANVAHVPSQVLRWGRCSPGLSLPRAGIMSFTC